jgi:hypothetical protein
MPAMVSTPRSRSPIAPTGCVLASSPEFRGGQTAKHLSRVRFRGCEQTKLSWTPPRRPQSLPSGRTVGGLPEAVKDVLSARRLASPAEAGTHRSAARTLHRLANHCNCLMRGASGRTDLGFSPGKQQIARLSARRGPDSSQALRMTEVSIPPKASGMVRTAPSRRRRSLSSGRAQRGPVGRFLRTGASQTMHGCGAAVFLTLYFSAGRAALFRPRRVAPSPPLV